MDDAMEFGTVNFDDAKLHVFPTAIEQTERAAQRVCEVLQKAITSRGRASIVLSGGNTPRRLFQLLSSEACRERVEWVHVDFFWGDERCVAPGDQESNYRMANETLLEPLGIEQARIHRIRAEDDDPHRAAADYQREIADYFAAGPAEAEQLGGAARFDLALLGMGDDGHTASLFPNTPALSEMQRWVVANNVPRLGAVRITLTYPLINRARTILFLIAGASKAPALEAVLNGPRDPQRWPSQGINSLDGQLEFFVDATAAKLLSAS